MNQESSNQLVKSEVPLGALIVATQDRLGSLKTVGEWVGRSGMFGVNTLEAGAMIAVQCVEEGLKISEWPRIYHMIGNKPSKRAIAAQVEFEDKGGTIEWIDLGSDGQKATARFTYPGKKPLEITFTIAQAERAQLVKADSNWQKWPDRMLRARVLSEGIALLAPKIYAGTYDETEGGAMPSLQLAPEPTTPPEPKPAKVVTVETVVEPAKRTTTPTTTNARGESAQASGTQGAGSGEAAPANAPTAPPAPRPNPSATTSVPRSPMTTETATALCAVLRTPEEILKATEFFQKQGWLAAGETIDDLSEGHAKKVIGNAAGFRQKVLGAA